MLQRRLHTLCAEAERLEERNPVSTLLFDLGIIVTGGGNPNEA